MKLEILEELDKLGIKYQKKGNRYFCCCPFHSEKTPSCLIDVKNNRYYCFGCGEYGSVYDLVSKIKGIPVSTLIGHAPKLSDELIINNYAKELYNCCLLNTNTGVEILNQNRKRGLTDEVVEYFSIGYAPRNFLHPLKEILEETAKNDNSFGIKPYSWRFSPLINEKGNEIFRERIMFPIQSINGNVLGFTGRTTVKEENFKYLNTSESVEFKKKNVLFNIFKAKNAIEKQRQVYIVEGPFDVIAYHLCGVENVVSPLTCSLSQNQLNLILDNFGKDIEFIIAFDNDTAGKKGIKNAIELLKQNSIWNYKIIQYKYKDAGEYVEYSKLEELKKLISSPLDIASYMSLFYLNTNDNKMKSKYINSFVSFIYGFPSFVAKDMLIKFEKLTNDKDKFAINLYLKRKTDKEILKFMFYQMQHSKQKLDAFKAIISESILSKNEVKVLEDIAKFNLRDYENDFPFSYLISSFVKLRCKELIKEEIF